MLIYFNVQKKIDSLKKVILTAVYTYGPVWPSDLTKLKAPNIIPSSES
jgi:hypothetical protein